MTDVKHYCNSSVAIVLIGSKLDLEDESKRMVTQEEAYQFADTNDLLFFETSAQTGENVQKVFIHSCSLILDQIHQGILNVDKSNGVWHDMIQICPSRDSGKWQTFCSRVYAFVGKCIFCCYSNRK